LVHGYPDDCINQRRAADGQARVLIFVGVKSRRSLPQWGRESGQRADDARGQLGQRGWAQGDGKHFWISFSMRAISPSSTPPSL